MVCRACLVAGDFAEGAVMAKTSLSLGIDESGTGAWSSGFTVTAYLIDDSVEAELRATGITDSKKLSDARRRELVEETAHHCITTETMIVPPNYNEQKAAWREAIAKTAKHCFESLDKDIKNCKLIIDGNRDAILADYFLRVWFIEAHFEPKADAKYAAVSAASVWAKTLRNDQVLKDHELYPQYGWNNNYGYGTEEHMEAICIHGISPLHRRITPLAHYFTEEEPCLSSRSVPGALMSSFTSSTSPFASKRAAQFRRS
jgi:ribonuclease HII